MNTILLITTFGLSSILLTGCIGCYNPTGCSRDTSPYYMTQTTSQVRGIIIPAQTKLKYQTKHSFQKEQQTHALAEQNLTAIQLPPDTAILWGDMPSYRFIKFFNSEMKGFSVYPAEGLSPQSTNEFVVLWQSCRSALDITLTNPNDWSFNPENMEIRGCGVNIQKRSQYNDDWPNQDQADDFLMKINKALHKLPRQQSYPVIYKTTN